MLQSLLTGVGASVALPALADAHPMQQHLANQKTVATAEKKAAAPAYKPEFLDAHQYATLEAIAERIVPGSTKARVAPFVDQLLAVDTTTSQRSFLGAMGAFEMQAIDKFSKPWKALTTAQQDELLTVASTAESGLKADGRRSTRTVGARRREGDHLRPLRQFARLDFGRLLLVGDRDARARVDGRDVLHEAARLRSSGRARVGTDAVM